MSMIETHWHWLSDYQADLRWQTRRRILLSSGEQAEAFLFSEHLPCITMGKRGGELRAQTSTPIFQINRGGLATWHGPGQLVLYPLLNLRKRNLGTKYFVQLLEASLLQTLSEYNISAKRKERSPGIWWNDQKLASVGLEIKNGISMHGCAINLNNSLQGFDEIVPCGFSNIKMISLSKILNHPIHLYDFGCHWKRHLIQRLY